MATNLVLEFEFAKRNRVFESILFGKLRHFYSVSWGRAVQFTGTGVQKWFDGYRSGRGRWCRCDSA